MNKKKKNKVNDETSSDESRGMCGIVMPISECDGCPEEHWRDVNDVLEESIKKAEFTPRIVSQSDITTVIHANIVSNLHDDEMIVCDVSGKNPNVMFELGIRLAFDKPTVIIKDNETGYSFDTSPIEHLEYPRSLHIHDIRKFQNKLTDKLIATYDKSKDSDYSFFLSHFGKYTSKELPTEVLPYQDFLDRRLNDIERKIDDQHEHAHSTRQNAICLKGPKKSIDAFKDFLVEKYKINRLTEQKISSSHYHFLSNPSLKEHEQTVRKLAKDRDLKVGWIT